MNGPGIIAKQAEIEELEDGIKKGVALQKELFPAAK